MSAQRLLSYFETAPQPRLALDAFFEAWGGDWSVSEELLDHYDASLCAFDPASNTDEAFRAFGKIYNELKGPNWQVFRPASPERDCWPPRQIFETIKREFPQFSWGGPVNLLTFRDSGTNSRLESHPARMQGIKPKKGYPHMTVSKFLHFYNPGLFPIYDNKLIWEKVFKCFSNDFKVFCERANIPYSRAINDDSATFLLYYMGWASELLAAAHGTFMQVFIGWLGDQPGAGLHQRKFDPATLYATAFEITVIGAAEASLQLA